MAKQLRDNFLDENWTFKPHFYTKPQSLGPDKDSRKSKSPVDPTRSYRKFYEDQLQYVNKSTHKRK